MNLKNLEACGGQGRMEDLDMKGCLISGGKFTNNPKKGARKI
jgi:hypothetical protein